MPLGGCEGDSLSGEADACQRKEEELVAALEGETWRAASVVLAWEASAGVIHPSETAVDSPSLGVFQAGRLSGRQ